jgi:hypothetical protein
MRVVGPICDRALSRRTSHLVDGRTRPLGGRQCGVDRRCRRMGDLRLKLEARFRRCGGRRRSSQPGNGLWRDRHGLRRQYRGNRPLHRNSRHRCRWWISARMWSGRSIGWDRSEREGYGRRLPQCIVWRWWVKSPLVPAEPPTLLPGPTAYDLVVDKLSGSSPVFLCSRSLGLALCFRSQCGALSSSRSWSWAWSAPSERAELPSAKCVQRGASELPAIRLYSAVGAIETCGSLTRGREASSDSPARRLNPDIDRVEAGLAATADRSILHGGEERSAGLRRAIFTARLAGIGKFTLSTTLGCGQGRPCRGSGD